MTRAVILSTVVLLLGASAWSQERNFEVTIQGTGLFSKGLTNQGLTHRSTNTAGILGGFRFNMNRWIGFEGNYDFYRNSHTYEDTAGRFTSIPTSTHSLAVSVVFRTSVAFLKPYALCGGAMMIFEPRGVDEATDQIRPAFVYGAGIDVPVWKRLALRAQYRGFIYSVPDFELSELRLGKHTHAAVPSFGIVVTF